MSGATIGNLTSLVSNATVPREGPKALNVLLAFTGGASQITVDLSSVVGNPGPTTQMSVVQGLFLDNADGTVDIYCKVLSTGQRIHFPAGSQLYVPIFSPATGPVFTFSGKGGASPGLQIPVYFYNMPLPALAIQNAGGAFSFSGANLLVQDTLAETDLALLASTVSGGAINVNGGGGGGGGFDGPLTWNFGTLTAGSGSAVLYTPAAGRKFYVNNFSCTADPNATAAGPLFLQVTDGAVEMVRIPIWLPAAPASVTAPIQIIPFSSDDMGWLSSTANHALSVQWLAGGMTAGSIRFNFSTLIGDHV